MSATAGSRAAADHRSADAVRALGGPRTPLFLAAVEQRLTASVAHASGEVADAGAATLAAGGKRLRPLLVGLSAPPDTRCSEPVMRAASAIELVHMATLVHDDVLDGAPLRRGRRTVWATHGRAVAAATGDYLFARAFAELAGAGDAVAIALLADASLDLARGEALQAEQAHRPDTAVEDYLERCRLKTARLFGAACALGGRLGGVSDGDVERLRRYGEALGIAFQVADDVLDCDGDPQRTGKALGTDLLDGTVTLPLLLAARSDPAVATAIRDGVGPQDVLPTLGRVLATGAVGEARKVALDYADRARDQLEGTGGGIDADALGALLRRAVERDA